MYFYLWNRTIIVLFLITCLIVESNAQRQKWVDSVYSSLSLEQKIAQLINIRVLTTSQIPKGEFTIEQVKYLIKRYNIGGISFFKGNATSQIKYTNQFQSIAQTPIMIGMDVEWGAAMRLDNIEKLPYLMTLGATHSTELAFEYGETVAAHCKRLGVHVSYGPVLDINSNPNNLSIGYRSIGDNKELVAKMGVAIIEGIQSQNIIACAKHFPGHGDVTKDSHFDLPRIKKNLSEVDTFELYPFKKAIRKGVRALMVGHLYISKDNFEKVPITTSKLLKELLVKKYKYRGLIFTDALNMKGFTNNVNRLEGPVLALNAGNDILLLPENVEETIAVVRQAILEGKINIEEFKEKVKKVLKYKYHYVLNNSKNIDPTNVNQDLNAIVQVFRSKMAKYSITVLKSSKYHFNKSGIHYIYLGDNKKSQLGSLLKKKYKIPILNFNKNSKKIGKVKKFIRNIKKQPKGRVIIGLGDYSQSAKNNFKIDRLYLKILRKTRNIPTTLIFFGTPYALTNIKRKYEGIIVAYENDKETHTAVFKLLAEQNIPSGALPVAIKNKYSSGYNATYGSSNNDYYINNFNNITTEKPLYFHVNNNKRLSYAIDKIVRKAIKDSIFPGCRIIVGRTHYMLMNKSYGTLNYNSEYPVTQNTLYDLASVTKILSTTLLAMRLYEDDQLSIYKKVQDYLPEFFGSDIGKIKIKNLLLHASGLPSWIPFHTIIPQLKYRKYLSKKNDIGFVNRVSKSLYAQKYYTEKYIFDSIYNIKLKHKGKYEYSDLGFIILGKIIERIYNGVTLDNLIQQIVLERLDLKKTTYNPLSNQYLLIREKDIAPTEIDNYFRYDTIQGYVHDYVAGLLGGVSGHAGLFSIGDDVAIISHMLLSNGLFRRKKFFKNNTVEIFTRQFSDNNRRGLGFDKPSLTKNSKHYYPSKYVSKESFGHTGFTGSMVWIDPTNDLYYIFLSNRTFPSSKVNKLFQSKTRENILNLIYEIGLNKHMIK